MKTVTFLLRAFGFYNFEDLRNSAFGFVMNREVMTGGSIVAFFATIADNIQPIFGVEWFFLIAYVGLVILEWITGVLASLRRGEKHQSRKLGRMAFKVFIYCILIILLHQMTRLEFPEMVAWLDAVNPFKWLYWLMVIIIIWQLWVSVLENLDSLGFRFAKVALKVINRNFERNLKINE